MPYKTNEDLPDNLREILPDHAQDIYRQAFNNAYEEYDDEKTAYRVAWAAVKNKYEKDEDGSWQEKEPDSEDSEKSFSTNLDIRIFGDLRKFEPLSDGSIKVYGIASTPIRDAAGEIVTVGAMSKAIGDYSRYPTIREMHRSDIAAGRALEIYIDDEDKTQLVAHVVDKNAVEKVKAKVYAGFSIGGRVKKRRYNDPSIIDEIELVEISLVDRPCNPEAAISLWKRENNMTGDLNKAGASDFEDKGRWDDGFDDDGADAGTTSMPTDPSDGGPAGSIGGVGEGDFDDSAEWRSTASFGASGSDEGRTSGPSSPSENQRRDGNSQNATVYNSRGGSPANHAGIFEGIPGADHQGNGPASGRHDNITTTSASSQNFTGEVLAGIPGAVNKRTFTAEQRKAAAKSGAAMKDGSYPIENKDDLANARRAIGRASPDKRAAVEAHIRRRAQALGVSVGKNIELVEQNSIHNTLDILTRADEAHKSALAALETLEVKSRRGKATPETLRLAKLYKAMDENELAEILASRNEESAQSQLDNLSKMKGAVDALTKEREELISKVDELTKGLEIVGERVKKLSDMPAPAKTAGSFAVSKGEDANGSGHIAGQDFEFTPDLREQAKKTWEGLSQDDRAMMMLKHSLSHGKFLNLNTLPNPPRSEAGGAAGR